MTAASVTFLVIGGVGLALLATSLFLGDVLHFGHPEPTGRSHCRAIAGFVGAFGFGASSRRRCAGSGSFAVVVALIAGVVVAIPAAGERSCSPARRAGCAPTARPRAATSSDAPASS